MKFRNIARKFAAAVPVLAATATMAHAVDDYSSITSAVSIGTVSAAIIAMAAIKILPNVAKWAGNKLANFF